jgi:hypothetical protein
MSNELVLRNVANNDLPIFFEYQLDQEANYMAAFTAKDPTNQEAFMAHWYSILATGLSQWPRMALDSSSALAYHSAWR